MRGRELSMESELVVLCWVVFAVLSSVHIRRQSERIGIELRWYDLTGALLLFPLYYLFWLFIWPGALRRSIDDLEIAKAHRRVRDSRKADIPSIRRGSRPISR